MKKAIIFVTSIALGFTGHVNSAEDEIAAKTLAELLTLVKEGKVVNGRVNDKRERDFLADKAKQRSEVRSAENMQRKEEAEAEAQAEADAEAEAQVEATAAADAEQETIDEPTASSVVVEEDGQRKKF